MRKKLLSMLVLLMTAATGAWADTTVTWTASDMSGIYIDFLDGEAYNNTIKGITVTSSGGGGAGASWERTDIQNSGSTTITFTSSVGKIKSIAITAEDIEMSSIPSGWTTDYSTLSWSGEASTTVPLPLSGWTEISGISEIVFTIESTVNVTGITLDKTEASMIVGGETLTLTPTVAPGNATNKTVTWTSSDESVATVANGVVTAVAAGTATITATATNGTAVTSDDKTATCTVTVAEPTYTVTLSEATNNSTTLSEKDGKLADVTLTRTLQTGGWNTFSVPFTIATPSGWTVKKLTDASYNSDTKTLSLTFGDAESIEAGKPYLVDVGAANVVNPTFNDVTIVNGTTPTTISGVVEFVPAINPVSMTAGDKTTLFVAGGNTLTYPNTTGNMKGFRAYFQLKGEAAVKARSFSLDFGDEDMTDIEKIEDAGLKSENLNGAIFDLSGRRVQNPTKGIYIKNGRKVVIK